MRAAEIVTETAKKLEEKWSEKYKRSINCAHPKGFSQKAHCAGRKKHTNENMDHSKDAQAVPELKAALVAHKKSIQDADNDKVYDIIDDIMTRIAKSHGISGQKLHDMWVEKYGQIPDTWIMKIAENFADGRVKGKSRPGRVKAAGASCDGSVTDLRARAKKYGGEKGKMYHWCANMKAGKN